MTNVSTGKKLLAAAVLACTCVTLAALPAYAFYYVHDEGVSGQADSKGAIEVFCVVDETANGGGVTSSLIILPEGSTADDCLDEAVISSRDCSTIDAVKSNGVESLGTYLSGKDYTVDVYAAASQKPGTQTTYDTASSGGEGAQIERYSNVVFTVGA